MPIMYRRNGDERWHDAKQVPPPHHQLIEAIFTHERQPRTGLVVYDKFSEMGNEKRISDIRLWRYRLAPTFRYPGDKPGSWQCPDEQLDDYPELATADGEQK